ncbi:hypothetical protein FRC15_011241, partial [Serendipita sp. 397]
MSATEGKPILEPLICRLPTELLQDIFHIVAQQSKTIRHIRLTCRYWRDLIASNHTLPRRIAIQHEIYPMESEYPYTRMWDYYAHTMKGLARALGYTQGSNFELYVTLNKPLFLEEEEEEEGETEEGALVPW